MTMTHAEARSVVVKRDEKCERLTAFIELFLSQSPSASDQAFAISAIVRSAESPIAKVLRRFGDHLAAQALSARIVFATIDRDLVAEGWLSDTGAIHFRRDLRQARDPRLIDAHEMLLLSPVTVWIGDSMRREPDKRDSYETYAEKCPITAARMRVSFERIWGVCEPLASCRPIVSTDTTPATEDLVAAAATQSLPPTVLVSTRH
jgi:hypothetical protein